MGSHLSVLDASGPEGSRKRNFPGSIPTVLNQRESDNEMARSRGLGVHDFRLRELRHVSVYHGPA